MKKFEKSTDELLNEIESTGEINAFLERNENEFAREPLHKTIGAIIEERSVKRQDVIARSGLNRIYAYQILQGKRLPSRDKLIALCFGLELNIDEANRLLRCAEFSPLYARNKRDSIIIFALSRGETIFTINNMLFEKGEAILTA